MGNLLDRSRDDEVEEQSVDQLSNHYGHHGYLYPPKSGCYFAGHFIMGGEKFETGQPEAYLFGDNMDLNFLGPKPIPFPYLAPLPDEPTRSLRALINIRKETLRLIKIPCSNGDFAHHSSSISKSTSGKLTNQLVNDNDSINKLPNQYELKELPSSSSSTVAVPTTSSSQDSSTSSPLSPSSSPSLNSSNPAQTQTNLIHETNQLLVSSSSSPSSSSSSSSSNGPLYTIEFTFDADVKCSITIYYLAVEETTGSGITYIPRDPGYKTETFHYPKGASQTFSQPSLIFNPSAFNEDDLLYRAIDEYGNFDPTVPFPIVIQVTAEEGSEPRQSHSLIATVERNNEKQFYIKPFKQKIVIDGLAYLIQEVYGIENKNTVRSSFGKPYYSSDEEIEDNGSECVICMSESRDTLILPCRHLCLCNSCADSLRYQANNCPICRSPFRALLQFRAVRKILNNGQTVATKSSSNVTQPVEPLNTSSSSKRCLSSSSESRNSHPTSSARPVTTTTAVDSTDAKSDTPPGYEAISLIEALNGPLLMSSSSSRPGDYGLYGCQGSFDDENVAPLASIEATTKSISGSSQSMIVIKDRDTLRHLKESISNNKHSRHAKSSSSSLSEIRYPIPSSSSSSPKMGSRSKSISKSKLAMVNNAIERGGKNYRSSESLTLWSQQGSPESGSEDQEKVKLLDQENSHHNHPRQKQTTSGETRSVYIEPIKSRTAVRKRGSFYDDSELKVLNSSSRNSSNNQLEMESTEALDINSINLSATSYPDLFLRDGVDEQRFMDETDMLSISTNDSVPNEFMSK